MTNSAISNLGYGALVGVFCIGSKLTQPFFDGAVPYLVPQTVSPVATFVIGLLPSIAFTIGGQYTYKAITEGKKNKTQNLAFAAGFGALFALQAFFRPGEMAKGMAAVFVAQKIFFYLYGLPKELLALRRANADLLQQIATLEQNKTTESLQFEETIRGFQEGDASKYISGFQAKAQDAEHQLKEKQQILAHLTQQCSNLKISLEAAKEKIEQLQIEKKKLTEQNSHTVQAKERMAEHAHSLEEKIKELTFKVECGQEQMRLAENSKREILSRLAEERQFQSKRFSTVETSFLDLADKFKTLANLLDKHKNELKEDELSLFEKTKKEGFVNETDYLESKRLGIKRLEELEENTESRVKLYPSVFGKPSIRQKQVSQTEVVAGYITGSISSAAGKAMNAAGKAMNAAGNAISSLRKTFVAKLRTTTAPQQNK